MSRRAIFFAALLSSIAIYELPYLLTLAKTGWSPLPPVVDYPADQMLYLNLSTIHHASATEVVNTPGTATSFPLSMFLISDSLLRSFFPASPIRSPVPGRLPCWPGLPFGRH